MFAPNVGRYPSQQIQCDNGRYARSPPITIVRVVGVVVLVAVVTLVVRRRAAAASATVRRGHGSAIPTRRRAA